MKKTIPWQTSKSSGNIELHSLTLPASFFFLPRMGEKLVLFKHIAAVFTMIQSFPDTKIGIASRTGTPDW